MAHSNTFDISTPTNDNFAGDGDDKIVQNQVDLKQRLELDHNMDGVLDTSLPTADGYHKKVTLCTQSSDPALLTKSLSDVAISIATPCVVTEAGHGLINGDAITFSTTGALPTGITAGIIYYVSNKATDTFNICTTYADAIAGTNKVTTTGSQLGVHAISNPLNGVIYAKSDGLYFRNIAGIVKLI